MSLEPDFERARSRDAKQQRHDAITASARSLALARGVGVITLTDIAERVGMHKSTMLRYFATREDILIHVGAQEWTAWSLAAVAALRAAPATAWQDLSAYAANALTSTLIAQPLLCDLLAHLPAMLRHAASPQARTHYVNTSGRASDHISDTLHERLNLDPIAAGNLIATTTTLAGSWWQLAAGNTCTLPGSDAGHRSDTADTGDSAASPCAVSIESALSHIVELILTGYLTQATGLTEIPAVPTPAASPAASPAGAATFAVPTYRPSPRRPAPTATQVAYRHLDTPIGRLLVAATEAGIVQIAFENEDTEAILESLSQTISPHVRHLPARLDQAALQLDEYFAGQRDHFEVPLDHALATGFRLSVQQHLPTIRYGQTATYRQVAAAVGNPRAVRAVGSACATNPHPIIVPCHRVLRSDGGLGGFRGGTQTKRELLTMEQSRVPTSR